MKITNPETGAKHDEPLCPECSAFQAIADPLCTEPHGTDDWHDTARRICAAVGHIPGTSFCRRCKEPNAALS